MGERRNAVSGHNTLWSKMSKETTISFPTFEIEEKGKGAAPLSGWL